MTLTEKATKEVQEWVDYYRERANKAEEAGKDLIKLTEKLDKMEVLITAPPEFLSISQDSIRIQLKTVEEARKFLGLVLEATDIDKFHKISSNQGDELVWFYSASYGDASITVGPAEPNRDCVPVKKVNTYTSWVCEQVK